MTDDEAIALYVAAGNPREDWWALDERDRYPYRKMALEGTEPGSLKTTSTPQVRGLVQRPAPAIGYRS